MVSPSPPAYIQSRRTAGYSASVDVEIASGEPGVSVGGVSSRFRVGVRLGSRSRVSRRTQASETSSPQRARIRAQLQGLNRSFRLFTGNCDELLRFLGHVRAITAIRDRTYGDEASRVDEPHTFDELAKLSRGAAPCADHAAGAGRPCLALPRTRALAKDARVGLTICSPCCARASIASAVARRPSAFHAGV